MPLTVKQRNKEVMEERDKIKKEETQEAVILVPQVTQEQLDQVLDQVQVELPRSHPVQPLKNTEPQFQEPKVPKPTKLPSTEAPSPSVDGVQKQQPEKQEQPVRKRVLTPREKDYYQFFDQRFGPLIVLVLYLTMADLQKATFYAPSPTECHDLAPHLARLGPKVEDIFHLPRWVHEVVVTSDDTFTVGMVLVGYLDRIGALEKLIPWFTGAASKVRRITNEQSQSEAGPIPIRPDLNGNARTVGNGPFPGDDFSRPAVDPRTAYSAPVDLSTVRGLGEQWSPL